MVLEFNKTGYAAARVEVERASRVALDVALLPEPREIVLSRSGVDACADLPAPPEGVPGLREYARLAVHHDGTIVVKAARLPFFGNLWIRLQADLGRVGEE